jgi:hypothetical protein
MDSYEDSEILKKIENENKNENENLKKIQKNKKKIENEKIKSAVFLAPKPHVRDSASIFYNENDNIDSKLKSMESPVRGMYTCIYIYICVCMDI